MTAQPSGTMTRRGLLGVAIAAGASVGGLLLATSAGAATLPSAVVPASTTTDEQVDPPRFRFECVTPVPAFAPLGRLEEVWASPRYLTFTDCSVSYIGAGPFVLTDEESAVVEVVATAGGDVGDRQRAYLTVLRASTRIDRARLDERLSDFGRPIIAGSLALAPLAPQAQLLANWLATGGSSR